MGAINPYFYSKKHAYHEGVPEFRQLDIRQWRKSGDLLAKVQWTLANLRESRWCTGESHTDSHQLAKVRLAKFG
jgi:hypothetical protein